MDKKSIKAWELYFDYLCRKWAREYGAEFVDFYFGADADAFWNGWFKSAIGCKVN